MTSSSTRSTQVDAQRGVALFTALMLLIVLSLLGVTALQVTALQERMAGNVREQDIAFQRAEAGLRTMEAGIAAYVMGSRGTMPAYGDSAWPTWVSLNLSPSDCTLLGRLDEDLDSMDVLLSSSELAGWRTLSGVEGVQVALVDLSDFADLETTGDSLGRGSNCRPMDEGAQDASNFYYLVTVRAQGPAGRARAILQSIFYWPN